MINVVDTVIYLSIYLIIIIIFGGLKDVFDSISLPLGNIWLVHFLQPVFRFILQNNQHLNSETTAD